MPNTATVAKARAMYSLHLKDSDYSQLAEMKRVEDIAMYFEKHPRYDEIMEGIRNVEIHRNILEQRIRVMVPLEYKSLLRFEQLSRAKTFFSLELERDMIVDMLYALNHGISYQPSRDIVEMSQSFSFNVAELVNCKSVESVLRIIQPSPYGHIVREAVESETPTWIIEIKLYDYYVQYVKEQEANINPDFNELFKFDVELKRVQEGLRMVAQKNTRYENIMSESTWLANKLSKNEFLEWVKGNDPDLYVANAKQKYNIPQEVYRASFENYCNRLRLKKALKTMRFSQDSVAVRYAYKMLMDIEVKNIITIIEGVRYRRNVQAILEQLVFEVKHGN